ncbi:phosphate ABC transporter substrate-binding protein PstS [Kovacikia minuta CCNUW1]|uniref:phosphate ABC transporter substrate-binding protein PstS n=1 Tax=Kovacikia minuta TaxID=2931930 RepID=UPI001CCAC5F1|nr:phosphate ABC transporter substrate-binding protein PstS [Kovacikia minuta]UBF26389.1 phosphate ABC transporter substrate-binding protein PstS [Kovacikia minuta CCNUW1]
MARLPQIMRRPQQILEAPSPAATAGGGGTVSLSGAGATFPAPLYQRWFSEFNKLNPNIQISYQSVGSGAGVKQFLAKTVDFGATDAPLNDKERASYPKDMGEPLQIPMTGGAVVYAFNLDGVDNLKLSRDAYCGITDGTIKTWNDPKIVKDNPDAKLPSSPITFIHRSDGSGTTFLFTSHIKAACPNWKAGASKSVEWPAGVGAKGNEGVTAQIQQTKGTIGYTEYSYAKENSLKMAAIQNKSGAFIDPSPEAAAKALEGAEVPADFALKVPDPAGKEAYPIVGLTWLLLHGKYSDQAKADALKNFIKWAFQDGSSFAKELGYLPLPNEVTNKAIAALDNVKVAAK